MQRAVRLIFLATMIGGFVSNVGCSDDDAKPDSGPVEAGSPDTGAVDSSSDVGVQDTGATDGPVNQPNLSCAGQPLPTTVSESVTINGTTMNKDRVPIPAMIEVLSADDDSVLDSMTTTADGQYTLTVATGGAPKAVYFHIVAEGYVETFRYFGYPLTGNTTSSQRVWSADDVKYYAEGGDITPTAGKGHLLINFRDCVLQLFGVPGVEVTTTPAAPILAYETGANCGKPDKTLTESTVCSQAFAYDLDPGKVQVQATFGNTNFRTQNVQVAADAMTWVVLQPER